MFLHNFKYELKSQIRTKDFIFWMMCFPIILGTFFYLGFGKLYQNEELFEKIPVAVVEIKADAAFTEVTEAMASAEKPLFTFEKTDKADAEKKLEDGEVEGIIFVDDKLSLTVKKSEIEQTIIKSFIEQYDSQKAMIMETAKTSPDKIPVVVEALSAEIDAVDNVSLTGGNMNPYDSYFQNLIAMVALFGAITGLYCATHNQANLSAIGARKSLSPTRGIVKMLSSLLAAFVTQLCSTCVCTTFVLFILRIDMGGNIFMIYVSGALGSFAGISLGFFIGSIGSMSEKVKESIATTGTLFLCFLSGLMIGDMKSVVEDKMPIVNRINPAALISDLFYCLTIYDDYARYTEKAVSLLIVSAIFISGGFLLTRRKTYESL